ncbi:HAMP domain-containing protein [Noviherbaspirillum saxi]|uniref:HAMP domain-containing protein n=2 Tax=Noviherbaspirillum saxi TaxID=2320863 RepID=A0A3A3G0E8_9BURK|nr:HAMP domain-containing protein [Noviherbaspirillum saxi]
MANLKIGKRLALGFGVLVLLVAGIAALGVQSLGVLHESTDTIVKNRYPQVVLATNVLLQVGENATSMRNMLLLDDREKLNSEINAIQIGEKSIADNLAKLEPLLSSAPGKKAFQDILQLRSSYQVRQAEFMKLAATGGTLDATALMLGPLKVDQQNYVNRIKAFIDGGGRIMEKSGEEAATQYRHKAATILALSAVAVLLACAFAYRIARSITVPVVHAVTVARAVAAGNLTSTIEVRTRDETGQLMQALHDMNASLQKIVREVRSGTETIASASSEIATGNMDLSRRTEQQAGSVEETSSTMEELTVTVGRNADHAYEANRLAAAASDVAANSSKVVSEVVATMSAIDESSKKIVDIISVINGIAFQTNILALNAAVEAARAGEQGRGFAVVAGEVRNLAQRSAAAAKEIKALIDNSASNVSHGSKLVEQAGRTMHRVVDSVGTLSGIVSEISAASKEQSAGLGQINRAIMDMDQTTQQNAALVEQAAAAAQSLQNQAAHLAQLVSVFKLQPK